MRSRADAWLAIVVLAMTMCAPAGAQPSGAASRQPDAAAIAAALDRVKADPNLATERTVKTLRWKAIADRQAPSAMPGWMMWMMDAFRWLAQITRVLVWCVVVILVAFLTTFVVRLLRRDRDVAAGGELVAPTHVHNLDIRPETLPNDVGAAARALWDNGEHRAALSLLYRGLLSRLVHVHEVPIRASSTEGDCLGLAGRYLATSRQPYVTQLIGVWQRAVYGHHDVDGVTVHQLCDGFAALDRADVPHAIAEGGLA